MDRERKRPRMAAFIESANLGGRALNQNHTRPKLTGNRCQCSACGEYFTSVRSFDRHRVGQFGIGRRCLTRAELDAGGFERNARGFRGEPRMAPVATHFDVAAPRSMGAMVLPGAAL
jgi:hypothetical protein